MAGEQRKRGWGGGERRKQWRRQVEVRQRFRVDCLKRRLHGPAKEKGGRERSRQVIGAEEKRGDWSKDRQIEKALGLALSISVSSS